MYPQGMQKLKFKIQGDNIVNVSTTTEYHNSKPSKVTFDFTIDVSDVALKKNKLPEGCFQIETGQIQTNRANKTQYNSTLHHRHINLNQPEPARIHKGQQESTGINKTQPNPANQHETIHLHSKSTYNYANSFRANINHAKSFN